MAHAVYTRDLGRSRSFREATVRSLAQALLKYERIETTLAKAKEAQRLVERLITLGKTGSLTARRQAISRLNDSKTVHRLFTTVAPRFSARTGGYTRIMHSGVRPGDGASLAVLELVELAPELKEEKSKKKEQQAKRPPKAGKPPAEESPRKTGSQVADRLPAPKDSPVSEAEKVAKEELEKKPQAMKKEAEPSDKSKEKKAEKKSFIGGLRRFFKDRTKD